VGAGKGDKMDKIPRKLQYWDSNSPDLGNKVPTPVASDDNPPEPEKKQAEKKKRSSPVAADDADDNPQEPAKKQVVKKTRSPPVGAAAKKR
jgi:hypothetical protein